MSCAKVTECLASLDDLGHTDEGQAEIFETIVTSGLNMEHDLALLFLAENPDGIEPMPVLTVPNWDDPARGLFGYDLTAFMEDQPVVTIAGYGGTGLREFGTTTLVSTSVNIDRFPDCDGVDPGSEVRPALGIANTLDGQSTLVSGDSGGPILFGPGPVSGSLPPPTPFPQDFPHEPMRYLAGVSSTGGHGSGMTLLDNADWLFARLDDIDADGYTNANDNCPSVSNNDQLNCNVDAELERQAQILGDACDPSPCPNFDSALRPGSGFIPGVCGFDSAVTLIHDRVVFDTIGSHNAFGGGLLEDQNVDTNIRFCQRDLDRGISCLRTDGQRLPLQLRGFPAPDGNPPSTVGDEQVGNPWLPMQFSTIAFPGSEIVLDYPSGLVQLAWLYTSDRDEWIDNDWIDDPGSAGLSGVLGADATDALGTRSRPENGLHRNTPPDTLETGDGLARTYRGATPDRAVVVPGGGCSIGATILTPGRDTFKPVPCVHFPGCPGISVTPPRLPNCLTCGLFDRPIWDWHALRPQGTWITQVPDAADPPGDSWRVVLPDGMAVRTSGVFGRQLFDRLDAGEVLVRTAEPFQGAGRGRLPAAGVLLSAGATELTGAVYPAEVGYLEGTELCQDLMLTAKHWRRPRARAVDDALEFATRKSFEIPADIPIVSDVGARELRAELTFGTTHHGFVCEYRHAGARFTWSRCSDRRHRPGDVVSTSSLRLSLKRNRFRHGSRHDPPEPPPDAGADEEPENTEVRLVLEEQTPCTGVAEPLPSIGLPLLASGSRSLRDYMPVLSQTLDALFIVGGRDEATGRLTRAISVTRLSTGDRFELDLPQYRPENVLAATVSPLDGSLWVLDERETRPCGSHPHRRGSRVDRCRSVLVSRLVRISPISGVVSVVQEGPSRRRFDLHWLTVDRDGTLLLSLTSRHRHAVIKLAFEAFEHGSERALRALSGEGRLEAEPLVDIDGYGFLVRTAPRALTPRRVPSRELISGPAVDLAEYL